MKVIFVFRLFISFFFTPSLFLIFLSFFSEHFCAYFRLHWAAHSAEQSSRAVTHDTCYSWVCLVFTWCYRWNCLFLIEFENKLLSLLRVWRMRLQVTQNLMTSLERSFPLAEVEYRCCHFWSKMMMSEVEQRPRLFMGSYGCHGSQWLNKKIISSVRICNDRYSGLVIIILYLTSTSWIITKMPPKYRKLGNVNMKKLHDCAWYNICRWQMTIKTLLVRFRLFYSRGHA